MGRTSRAEIVVRLAKVVELALGDLGLTENQYRALTLIDTGTASPREFAIRLAMKPPNVSTLIEGLAGRGLVRRQRDPADGRRVVLRLTASGQRLLATADARAESAIEHVASFDEGREIELLAAIDHWQTALDRVAVDLRHHLASGLDPTSKHQRAGSTKS
jgi:DNA-binding MarR family transcriptional regulator